MTKPGPSSAPSASSGALAFTKMHGLGNDYVYISCFDQSVEGLDPPALARAVSDRHTGIGSDGLILIRPPDTPEADVRMEMYNADGSRGAMCGNGIRCVAKYAIEHGLVARADGDAAAVRIATDRGVLMLEATLHRGRVERVRVDMGPPILRPADIPVSVAGDRCVRHRLRIGGEVFQMTCVSMGNPHAVIFVDSLGAIDLSRWGPALERDPLFPDRVNVHVATVQSRAEATMRTWERGSGSTRACGTGACAVLVAGVLEARLDRAAVIHLPGGDLEIEWSEDRGGPVFMTGSAVEVFSGRWPL
ncbi:MAG: diaminopimelate epimerase [Phycisphaerae bacterium]